MSTILQNHYVLAVHNLRESSRFFVDVLGFKIYSEPPGWIFIVKDNCMIMLGACPNDRLASEIGCHNYFAYLRVDDVNGYYVDVQRRGGKLTQPLADKPWGMRRFGVKTPEGHRLMIGQIITPAAADGGAL